MFKEFTERGLIKQTTHENPESLFTPNTTFYIGFDPTADSLHVGHLLQIITAKRLQNHGLTPILLIGGATAQLGDPTGKSEMRKMLSQENLDSNINSIKSQLSHFMPNAIIVNNNDWFSSFNFLSFMRDIGSHFSVNSMLRADAFRTRMESGSLTMLEFNYMLLQAFDFFHLNQKFGCTLEVGGNDQWSNILAGIDLTFKKSGNKVFGLTIPLLVNSNGQKMGKTEKGAVWLDPNKTSIFDFFQFWRNIPDENVLHCLKVLTFLSIDEINAIPFSSSEDINKAKEILALKLTSFVHGEDKANEVFKQVKDLFDNNSDSLPAIEIDKPMKIVELVVKAGFAASNTEARNLIKGNGISIKTWLKQPGLEKHLNQKIINDINEVIDSKEFVLKKGKKNFCKFIMI